MAARPPLDGCEGPGAVTVLWVFGAALVMLVLFNVAYFNGFGTDPAILRTE